MNPLNIRNLRSNEGYFSLDHRGGMSMPDEMAVTSGLPPGAGVGLFEAPTYTCSHCQRVVILNPNRQRERYVCRGCDHNLCDTCGAVKAAGAPCKTFKQLIDEMLNAVSRDKLSPEGLILS